MHLWCINNLTNLKTISQAKFYKLDFSASREHFKMTIFMMRTLIIKKKTKQCSLTLTFRDYDFLFSTEVTVSDDIQVQLSQLAAGGRTGGTSLGLITHLSACTQCWR